MAFPNVAALLLLCFSASLCAADKACGGDAVRSDYEVDTLISASSWHINRDCLWPHEIGGKCNYYFAFDQPLASINGCESASACAVYENGSTLIIGTYDSKVDEFCLISRGGTSFIGILSNGAEYNTTVIQTNLSLIVEFECKKNEDWYVNIGNSSQVPAKSIDSFVFQEAAGRYLLKVHYAGACIEEFPIEVPIGISVGSVLLIILVCVVAVYFGVGSIINYSSGKRGVEILPNASLWSQLPDNVKTGFAFSLSSLKCSSSSQASAAPNSSSSDNSAFTNESRYGTI